VDNALIELYENKVLRYIHMMFKEKGVKTYQRKAYQLNKV